MRTLFCFILMLFATSTYAFDIIGTWKLIAIERQNATGEWHSDCHQPTGMIIYTQSGDMAAGLNCMLTNTEQPSFAPEDTAFYIGTYTRKNNLIYHHIQNASSPLYYGTTQIRELEIINNHEIYLCVKSKDGSMIRLRWQRAKK